VWNESTSLGLVNSSADRNIGTVHGVSSKEACCGLCHAKGGCRSAHYSGDVCNMWSGYHPRRGTGTACVPQAKEELET
jgi:hypothetical protein